MWTVNDDAAADRLRHLIVRIARRDHAAFTALYDDTFNCLRDGLDLRLGDTAWADGVLAATYVEIWWLAGGHTHPASDAVAWMNDIVERRVAEGPPVSWCAETGPAHLVRKGRTGGPAPASDRYIPGRRNLTVRQPRQISRRRRSGPVGPAGKGPRSPQPRGGR
jgi:hypothetical protein